MADNTKGRGNQSGNQGNQSNRSNQSGRQEDLNKGKRQEDLNKGQRSNTGTSRQDKSDREQNLGNDRSTRRRDLDMDEEE